MRLAIVICALVAFTAPAGATPSQDLDRGRTSFQRRDWQSAIPVLNALLYPPPPRLSQTRDVIEAYLLLGGALFESGDRQRARTEFENALRIDPDTSLSRLTYGEDAIKLFEDVRADIAAKRAKDAEAKRIADAKAAIEAYKKSLVVYEATPFGYNFLPFGIAQFSQKRYVPGTLFAAGQVATLAANVSIYVYLVGTYGFSNDGLTISEGRRALRLQQLQIGTGIAFLGLYGFSIFDAIRHHKPRLRVEGDDSLIPEELRDRDNAPPPAKGERKLKKVSLWQRLQVAPMVTDESVGIGIGWEND